MLQKKDNRAAGELEGAKAPLEIGLIAIKTPDLSGFLTSVARFFVKTCFHKKCDVFEACKKVKDFFDTLSAALHFRSAAQFFLEMSAASCYNTKATEN